MTERSLDIDHAGVRMHCEAPRPRSGIAQDPAVGEPLPPREVYWQCTIDGKPYRTDVPTSALPDEVRGRIIAWYDREDAAGRFSR